MFITPMQRIDSIGLPLVHNNVSMSRANIAMTPSIPFDGFFRDILQNVIETDKIVAKDALALATGQSDDLHTIMLNQSKAQMSVQLMVQVRNRLMESYSEIMRINL